MSEGWRRVPLRKVATLDLDRVKVEEQGSYAVAGVFNAGAGLFPREPIDGSSTNYPVLYRLHADQLVMRKLTAWEGPITTVENEYDGYFVSPEFPTFTLDQRFLAPSYMRLICQTPSFWEAMKNTSTGTVQRRKRVSPSALLSIELDLPPLEEQRRIVNLVDSADSATQQFNAVSASSWTVSGAILRNHEESVIGEPVALSSLLESTVGGVWGSEPGTDAVDVQVVRSTEFSNDGRLKDNGIIRSITASQLASRKLTSGDILLEKSGGGPKQPVGRVVFVEKTPAIPTVCANFVQLVRPNAQRVDPHYLFLRMLNWHRSGRTLEFQSQTTGIRNLRTKDYLGQAIVIPSIDRQRAFAALVMASLDVTYKAAASADASLTMRSSLLAALLSGSQRLDSTYDLLLDTP
jgi:type I restriction enzyme, S subunit